MIRNAQSLPDRVGRVGDSLAARRNRRAACRCQAVGGVLRDGCGRLQHAACAKSAERRDVDGRTHLLKAAADGGDAKARDGILTVFTTEVHSSRILRGVKAGCSTAGKRVERLHLSLRDGGDGGRANIGAGGCDVVQGRHLSQRDRSRVTLIKRAADQTARRNAVQLDSPVLRGGRVRRAKRRPRHRSGASTG